MKRTEFDIESYFKAYRVSTPEDVVRSIGSGARMDMLFRVLPLLDRAKWFRLLGEEWPSCDDIGPFTDVLTSMLKSADPAHIDLMMTDRERAVRDALPPSFTAWRGCYYENKYGLSYSLSRDVARQFPFLSRYRRLALPLLVTASIGRSRAILKLDRGEREVIATERRIIAVTPLSAPTKKKAYVVVRNVRGEDKKWNHYYDVTDAEYEVQELRARGHVARVERVDKFCGK